MSWERVRLSDCCVSIADGDHQAPPKSSEGIPFVTIANITNNRFDFANTMYVPESYYEKLDEKRKPHRGDVLYSVVGSFGIPVLLTDETKFVFQRHIAILRPNEKILSEYLYYTMRSPAFYAKADIAAIGAAQRTISLSALRNMEVELPPISVQKAVVQKLHPLDMLIDNNQRQIKLLEEAAQRLYKEWFVDLRFPGHETTTITDGIPEGWGKYKFSEKVSIMSGGTPKTDKKEYYDGDIPFYSPKDSDGAFFAFDTETHISELGLKSCNSPLFPENTIIITARGTVGKTTILGTPMAMNQSCYAIKCDSICSPYYLFFALNQEAKALKTMSNGGVFNTIIVKTFDSISIVFPKEKLLRQFENVVTGFMEQIKVKMMEIKMLSEARDRLLPKLMNGEFEVN